MVQDNFINPRKFSALLRVIIVLIPSLVLIGWLFDIKLLKSILPNMVAMNPFTAVLLIFSGFSLYLIKEKNTDQKIKIGKYIGLAIFFISFIRLAGFNSNLDIGIDQILFGNKLQGNKTSPNTTINFILIGLSLFLVDYRKKYNYVPSQMLAFLAFIISLFAIIGYLYSATSLYRLSAYSPMRFHTAITFLLLSMGVLLSRYRHGLVSVIVHKNYGGFIARRLIPIGIAVPILVGFLRLEGQKLNLYDPQFGSALGVILIISISSLLMWWTTKSLNKTDDKRKMAELALIKTKNELAENELKYRNLIDNAGVSMFTSTLNGRFTFVNNKASQLTGYNIEVLTGMSFSDLVEGKDLEKVKANYLTQIQNNIEETHMEFCIHTKSGDTKYVEQSAVILKKDNMPVGFHCVVKDITQKREMESIVKKYEVKLFENQERLQAILDNTTSLIYIKDVDGKYLLTNKKFKEALNVNDETVIGKTDFDFGDIEQAQRFKASDEEVLKTLKQVELEEVIEMADGMHNILIIKFPLLNSENEIYGISGIATDITDRVTYQQQILEAKKMAEQTQAFQEQFLANMSHEIRTPMNGIKGMTDLLLKTQLNDEQKDFTKTIKRSSDSLLVIINDILDLSKIQAGKLTIEKINFNIREVLENVKGIFKYLLNEKGLILELSIHPDVPTILNGDPHRLNQILVNLLSNAIKFTASGSIDIKVSIEEKIEKEIILNFTITDTGIGIEKDNLNKIFDSFAQANMSTSRKYGGTGLGLSISRQLLELQGGKISVESEINKGSIFKFTIPYNYNQADRSRLFIDKDSKEYHSLLNGKKFLVVEDNEVNQKVTRHVLQQAGGMVDIAHNGLEAIALLEKSADYDVIIMDLQMPQMGGCEATAHIRNVMKLSMPIIAMTANALTGEKEKCIEIGMSDYISKPFDFAFFYQRLNLLLSDKANNSSVNS